MRNSRRSYHQVAEELEVATDPLCFHFPLKRLIPFCKTKTSFAESAKEKSPSLSESISSFFVTQIESLKKLPQIKEVKALRQRQKRTCADELQKKRIESFLFPDSFMRMFIYSLDTTNIYTKELVPAR